MISEKTPIELINEFESKEQSKERLASLEMLFKYAPDDLFYFKYFENLFLSDQDLFIRVFLLRNLPQKYPEKSIEPIKYVLQKDQSFILTLWNMKEFKQSEIRDYAKYIDDPLLSFYYQEKYWLKSKNMEYRFDYQEIYEIKYFDDSPYSPILIKNYKHWPSFIRENNQDGNRLIEIKKSEIKQRDNYQLLLIEKETKTDLVDGNKIVKSFKIIDKKIFDFFLKLFGKHRIKESNIKFYHNNSFDSLNYGFFITVIDLDFFILMPTPIKKMIILKEDESKRILLKAKQMALDKFNGPGINRIYRNYYGSKEVVEWDGSLPGLKWFWDAWRSLKQELKAIGFGIFKDGAYWIFFCETKYIWDFMKELDPIMYEKYKPYIKNSELEMGK